MDYIKFLPMEILIDILSRLPSESVVESKSVCRTWRNLASRQSFSTMHFDLHNNDDSGKIGLLALACEAGVDNEIFWYIEYSESNHDESTPILRTRRLNFTPPVRNTNFIGSCDGLICLSCRSVCICNPITKECVVLPDIVTDCDMDQYDFSFLGFGCVSSTKEYKVVKIYVSKLNTLEIHIYTLGSGNGWRNIGKFGSRFSPYGWVRAGIFANGAIYWMGRELEMIVSFDLAEERFCGHVAPPPLPRYSNWSHNRIGVLDGLLAFAVSVDVLGERCFDVWLLKKNNDNQEMEEQDEDQSLGWSEEFRGDSSLTVAVTEGGDVLTYSDYYLNIYDTQTSTSNSLVKFKKRLFRVFPHQNTLVSLKGLGEEDTQVMESIEVEEDANPGYRYL